MLKVQTLIATFTMRGGTLEVVSETKFLGSSFTSDGTLDAEIFSQYVWLALSAVT